MHSTLVHLFLILIHTFILTNVQCFSNSVTNCQITVQEMAKGMGGTNSDLGYALTIQNVNATNVELTITNPETPSLSYQGLLIWAQDEMGNSVGTWSIMSGQGFLVTCQGQAVTHLGSSKKQSNTVFNLNVGVDTPAPIFVRAVIVVSRTRWQITRLYEIDDLGVDHFSSVTASTAGQNSFSWVVLSAVLVGQGVALFWDQIWIRFGQE